MATRSRLCSSSSTRASGTSGPCCGPIAEPWVKPEWIVVIDDTGFAKKGRQSVGVARQYSGSLGKTDNCQVAVLLQYPAPKGYYPLARRLHVPHSWTPHPQPTKPPPSTPQPQTSPP